MSINAIKAYLGVIRWRYHQAKRPEKTKKLDELWAFCYYRCKFMLPKNCNHAAKGTEVKTGLIMDKIHTLALIGTACW